MKNKLFTLALLAAGFSLSAQVGINTGLGQASLDVVGFPSDVNKMDGVIAPRLTGAQLKAKTYTNAQTGAIVYVTMPEATTPTGQTIDVLSAGYYYFDGTKWASLSADWRTVGNAGTTPTTAGLGTDISTGNYLGTSDGKSLVLATQKNVKGILDVDGTLRGGNSNSVTGPFASFTWGSNNVLSNSTTSNIALGKDNTVSSQGNFPSVAIGLGNTANNGAKIIGNNNTATGANNFVFGNSNTVTSITTGLTLGNNNTNGGGIIVGGSNTVTQNNIAVGSGNNASGSEGVAIGFSATAQGGQTVFANGAHIFLSKGNGAGTVVGINMIPSVVVGSGAAIQMKGVAPAGNGCTAAEEGSIRYNATAKTHEGCNGTVWKAFY